MDLLAQFLKRGNLALSIVAGVQARLGHPPIFQSPFVGLIERDHISAAKAEVCPQRCALAILLALDGNAQNPTPRP